MDGVRIVVGGPVDETTALVSFLVAVDVLHDVPKELRHVGFLLGKIGLVAIEPVEVVMDDDPPQ